MKLNLKNPIVFFDLETTGTSINVDRIVEICYLKVHPNGNEEAKTLRINPEMHIPEGASAVQRNNHTTTGRMFLGLALLELQ